MIPPSTPRIHSISAQLNKSTDFIVLASKLPKAVYTMIIPEYPHYNYTCSLEYHYIKYI